MTVSPYIAICPGCSARLNISEKQIHAASGQVRCAVCRTVFFAPEQLLRGFFVPNQKKNTSVKNTSVKNTSVDDNLLFLPDADLPVIAQISSFDHTQTEREKTQDKEKIKEIGSHSQSPLQKTVPDHVYGRSDVQEKLSHTQASHHEHTIDEVSITHNDKQTYVEQSEDELPTKPLMQEMHASRDNLQQHRRNTRPVFQFMSNAPRSTMSTSLWWLASFFLVILLIGLVLVSQFHSWQKQPLLRGIYANVCIILDCELEKNIRPLSMRASPAGQNEMSPGIYSVQGLLENMAYYSQPLPVIRLTFIDLQGNSFAQRDFIPSEYAAQDIQSLSAKEQMKFNVRVELQKHVDFHLVPSFSLVSYY